MTTPELLETIKATLNLEELTLDDDGCCILTFDDTPVTLQATQGDVIFTSFVAQIASPPDAGLLKQLLAANLYWNASRGCTLALEPESLSVLAQFKVSGNGTNVAEQITSLLAVTEEFAPAIAQYAASDQQQEKEATPNGTRV